FCGKTLVSHNSEQIVVWQLDQSTRPDWQYGRPIPRIATLHKHKGDEILCKDSDRLFTYSTDSTSSTDTRNAALWDIRPRDALLLRTPFDPGPESASEDKQLDDNKAAVVPPHKHVVFSPDSRRILTTDSGGVSHSHEDAPSPIAQLWDAKSGTLIATLQTA